MKHNELEKHYVIASNKPWGPDGIELLKNKGESWTFVNAESKLNEIDLNTVDSIFFVHWSYKVPSVIYGRVKCIAFHMTDLPFGRGGSPLQNLIERGFTQTKLCAFKMVEEMDSGPIYLKNELELYGSAEEIYYRSSKLIYSMIREIIDNNIMPVEQRGREVKFTRRTAEMSEITPKIQDVDKLYDVIRMLDAPGYPKAFVNIGNFNVEFSKACLAKDSSALTVQANIRLIKNE